MCKINFDLPLSPALSIVCIERLMTVLSKYGTPVPPIVKKTEGVVMIKFNGIAHGALYYFNVNWSPGWSHYLRVSHYVTWVTGQQVDILIGFSHRSPTTKLPFSKDGDRVYQCVSNILPIM